MSGRFTEDHVEQACLDWLEALGYSILHGPDISPDGDAHERAAYDANILIERLFTFPLERCMDCCHVVRKATQR